MSGRRYLLAAFLAACASVPLFAAQPAAKIPRLAIVHPNVPLADMQGPNPADGLTRGIVKRLRQLGYVEGSNIAIERRSAEGLPQRLREVMEELAGLPVDLIVTFGQGATEARRATASIPIVAYLNDPVARGLSDSLSRPTQNVTGVTMTPGLQLIGKTLQLLKQAAPSSRRVAVIDFKYVDAKLTSAVHERRLTAEAAARDLGLTLIPVGVNDAADLEQAFATIDKERADAVMDMSTPVTWLHRRRIIDFVTNRRLPSVSGCRVCVEEGGLMSYASADDAEDRLAEYADRILRGAKPADLPFEQPSKYELVINLRTAALLGLTIPQSLLLIADVVN
jgi:putative ABC transport system substrate-binding protein